MHHLEFTVCPVSPGDAETYSCIVMSTIDNSTVNDTSEVTIQCKLSLISIFEYYMCYVAHIVFEDTCKYTYM